MRGQWLRGAIAILGCASLVACAPYGYGGNGYGPYGYGPYGNGPYGNGPYGNGPYGNGPYGNAPYGNAPYGIPPPPPPPPPPYSVPQSLSQTSYNFVINLALIDSYQTEAGQMPVRRGASAQIRQLSDRMVRDYGTATQQLTAALQNNRTPVTTPAALDPRHQAMINDLGVAMGPEFDRRYAVQQVAVNQEAVALLQNYAQNGDNPALKQLASQALPAVQDDLRAAQMFGPAAAAVITN